jgi:hypothetical protein
MERRENLKAQYLTNNPEAILDFYPGIRQLLDKKIKRDRDVQCWREFHDRIQLEGDTCSLEFYWRKTEKGIEIQSVNIFVLCKAPTQYQQYEI